MSNDYSWLCPRCNRRVPNRAQECHCGFERSQLHADERSGLRDQTTLTSRTDRRRGIVVAGAILICLSGLALWTATRQQKQHRFGEDVEKQSRKEKPNNKQLPTISTESKPTEVEPGSTVDGLENEAISGTTLREETETTWPSSSPNVVNPASETPDTASKEDERLETRALLEARLMRIAVAKKSLKVAYQVFSDACQSSRPDTGTESDWLFGLKRGPDKAAISQTPPTRRRSSSRRSSFDCAGSWKDLTARVNDLKATLHQAADLARRNNVLPGDWRKMLDAHRLTDLQDY